MWDSGNIAADGWVWGWA